MPIDTSTFLAELAESRRAAQLAERKGFVPASGLVLPVALEAAIRRRLLLTPALARSRLATTSAIIGVPSCEREQVEYWFAHYGDDANWLLETGESGVISLEVDQSLSRSSLAHLASANHSWQHTLHFAVQGNSHFLFEYVAGLPSLRHFPGLRLHSGNSILVPPSRTPAGMELVYEDPCAPLLPADWLREAAILR